MTSGPGYFQAGETYTLRGTWMYWENVDPDTNEWDPDSATVAKKTTTRTVILVVE